MAGVNRNVTANGVIIGNVALVALPSRESQNTPVNGATTGTGGQNGAAAGNGVQTGAAGGNGVHGYDRKRRRHQGRRPATLSTGLQRDGDVTGNLGTLTPPGTVDTTPGGVGRRPGQHRVHRHDPRPGHHRGATGVVGGRVESPYPDRAPEPRPEPAPGRGRAPGAGRVPTCGDRYRAGDRRIGGGLAPGAGPGATTHRGDGTPRHPHRDDGGHDPLERVRTACPTLADIRVVNDETDRARLAEITAAVRSGRPVTEFMSELATMAQRATSAGPGASGRQRNRPENSGIGCSRATWCRGTPRHADHARAHCAAHTACPERAGYGRPWEHPHRVRAPAPPRTRERAPPTDPTCADA